MLPHALFRLGLLFGKVLEMTELGVGGILQLTSQVVEVFESFGKLGRVELVIVLLVGPLQYLGVDSPAHRIVDPCTRLIGVDGRRK